MRATAALWIEMWWVQKFGLSFLLVISKCVRDVGQKGRLDAAILEFVILRGSLLSCCKVLVLCMLGVMFSVYMTAVHMLCGMHMCLSSKCSHYVSCPLYKCVLEAKKSEFFSGLAGRRLKAGAAKAPQGRRGQAAPRVPVFLAYNI